MFRMPSVVVSALLLAGVLVVGCPLTTTPVLVVSASSHHFGLNADNSFETTWTFQVSNGGPASAPLDFTVLVDKAWMSVDPASGQSADADNPVTITVTIDRNFPEPAKAIEPDFLLGTVVVESAQGEVANIAISTAPDFFTEEFDGPPDLANKMITFTPDGSVSWYCATIQDAEGFPTDPDEGEVINYLVNDPLPVLPNHVLPLYGVDYDIFFVSSYGYITFGTGGDLVSLINETLGQHFSTPRISGLSSIDAGAGGTTSLVQASDRVAVTFLDVPVVNNETPGLSNFQIEMFFDGIIRLTFLDIDVPNGIVGLSFGPGNVDNVVPADFVNSDFTALNTECLATTF